MRIVFVRHGERSSEGDGDALTAAGLAMAEETGRWLREQGISPALVVRTRSERTRQTAERLLAGLALTSTPIVARSGLPRSLDKWAPLVGWLQAQGAGDAVLVGHGATQGLVERQLGGAAFAVPSTHRAAAFVLEEVDPGGWRATTVWPGRPSRSATSAGAPTGGLP